MKQLKNGEFFGSHYHKSSFENLVITDTEYTHNKVDWHYHENPYFTFLLEGKLYEANKKEDYFLKPGSLLFHNWQDEHYNVKPSDYTRGFHIELKKEWLKNYGYLLKEIEGSFKIDNPLIKDSFIKIFIESKINDKYSDISVNSLIIELVNKINTTNRSLEHQPLWVERLREIIYEEDIDYSLENLSLAINVHPIHLSREFSKYFGTNLGNYIRHIKLNNAFHLIHSKKYTLTEISHKSGYYDQSHFIKNFKRVFHKTPKQLIKEIM